MLHGAMLSLRSESDPGEARLAALWRAFTETIGDAPHQRVIPLSTLKYFP